MAGDGREHQLPAVPDSSAESDTPRWASSHRWTRQIVFFAGSRRQLGLAASFETTDAGSSRARKATWAPVSQGNPGALTRTPREVLECQTSARGSKVLALR